MRGSQDAATGNRFGPLRGTRTVALAVFLAGSTAFVPGFTQTAFAQTYSFTSVTIEGNSRVDPKTILSYAGIGRGQQVTGGQLNDAYQRIMDSGLFETVEMDPQGSQLIIHVREYPIIDVISIEGNKRLDDAKLMEIIASRSRTIYSPATALADAEAITEAYRVSGRLAATVNPRIIRRPDNRVDLVFEITEGKVTEVERLAFNGNRAFSDYRLRQVLETKQAGWLRQVIQRDTFIAERLEQDKQLLRDFYQSRGYIDFEVLDASADVVRERNGVFLTFTLHEGQKYSVSQTGVTSTIEGLDAADFQGVIKLGPGDTYSPVAIENDVTRLENLAVRKGLNFVNVRPQIERDERNQTLAVTYVLEKGERLFVERIDIEGNTTTLDYVVRRQFRTAEGDPFNPREIRQAADRIRGLGFFSDAQVNTQPGSAADQVIVNVDVVEKPTGSLSFGATYALQEGFGFTVGFAETNFLGRGQTLKLDLSTGTDNQASSFSFAEPGFLGRDLRFATDIYYNQSNSDGVDYNTKNVGLVPSLEFPLGELSRLRLTYGLTENEIGDVDKGSSPILHEEASWGGLVSSYVGYDYTYDTRVNGLDPVTNYLLRFGQDFSGLGGETQYIRTDLFAVAQTKLFSENVVVRAIFEGGVINSFDDYGTLVTQRYSGNNKVRGFQRYGYGPRDTAAPNDDALGGNIMATLRFEADFPLGLPEEYGVTGGLFWDNGSVWGLNDTMGYDGETVDDAAHLRSSIGVTIYWTTPIGPLKFSFAKVLESQSYDKEQPFDFTVATTF